MTSPGPPLLRAYRRALSRHAHWLIAEGYERMDKTTFAREHEPAITGALVREMRAYLESGSEAPRWASLYSIHDDPPLDVDGRRGSSRPKVDIEFEQIVAGKRPRLRFEAKRLCRSTRHTLSRYLGKDGLGCFLSGRYPTTHGEAGMLGYVQEEAEADWAERLKSRLSPENPEHRTVPPLFSRQRIHTKLRHTYLSHHSPPEGEGPILINHVLLRFG